MSLLPWHREVWPALQRQMQAGRHHAWLLHGMQGTGKWELAFALAQARLCLSPHTDGQACGECEACRLHRTYAHPDFQWLAPEAVLIERGMPCEMDGEKRKPSAEIRVDETRAAIESFSLTTHHSRGRVCLVYVAEDMNTTAANTLLKTLEEPPAGALFIVVSHQPGRVLPTVRSRCLPVTAPAASAAQALPWLVEQGLAKAEAERALAASGGAPMRALQLAQQGDALWPIVDLASAARWRQMAALDYKQLLPQDVISLLQRWLADVCSLKAGGAGRYFPQLSARTAAVAHATSWGGLRQAESLLKAAWRNADHPVNAALMMGALLLELETHIKAR
jgi:DNA polymerase-3 subunit delta'